MSQKSTKLLLYADIILGIVETTGIKRQKGSCSHGASVLEGKLMVDDK
jgi:hypothetical protein